MLVAGFGGFVAVGQAAVQAELEIVHPFAPNSSRHPQQSSAAIAEVADQRLTVPNARVTSNNRLSRNVIFGRTTLSYNK